MSTSYPQQTTYTAPQAPVGTYYQVDAAGQPVYVYDPQTAVRDQALTPSAPTSVVGSWFDYSNPSYIKGLLVGVGATLLVTNPTVQTAVVKGAVAAWGAVVGGVEEIKEKVRDARAEKSMT